MRLATDQLVYQARPLTTAAFVGLGMFSDGRFGVFDTSGQLLRTAGDLPPSGKAGGNDALPPSVRQHAYQGYLSVAPDRSILVVANRHAGRIEMYRADGTLVRLVATPDTFPPQFQILSDVEGPILASGDALRFGYIDVVTADSLVYALFSGLRRGEADRANFGRYVHVFGYDGDFIQRLQLDGEHPAIALDPDGRTLYATSWDPIPSVVKYRLPSRP